MSHGSTCDDDDGSDGAKVIEPSAPPNDNDAVEAANGSSVGVRSAYEPYALDSASGSALVLKESVPIGRGARSSTGLGTR
ncbi:hypothetical protein A0H81_01333 [Grifola frondosa]|uniref:Uncharacterized protein n=1 Tax=Grifola frondosa TaxID=5627 RepID=A0A1C7MQ14_GRIFR|nr:hypothetical protein A0H81_01333 [Grifola frondosa]